MTLGKWALDSLRALDCELLWIVMEISHIVCFPWSRLRTFLQEHDALVTKTGAGALAHLVWYKAERSQQKNKAKKADELYQGAVALTQWQAWLETWQRLEMSILCMLLYAALRQLGPALCLSRRES